jgi:hypothetical protein
MYKVEKIIDKKEENGKQLYKIKWKGWSMKDCTWEPHENLTTVEEMLEEFNNRGTQKIPIDTSADVKKKRGRPKGTMNLPAKKSPKSLLSFVDKNDDKENEIDSSTDDMEVRVVPTKEKKEIPVADLTHDADDVLTESILEKEDASDEVIAYEIPERVLSAKKTKTDGILFLCEWKERKDGSKLKDCYITNEAMITYFPSLLIKFYQDKHFSN